jgi:hypothetical protein
MKFPIKLGKFAGGNPALMRALKNGVVKHPYLPLFVWTQRIQIGDFTGDADGDQTLTMSSLYPRNPFPTDVEVDGAYVRRETNFTGGAVSACTFQAGDAGDTDALVTATSVFTGAGTHFSTSGAAEFARHLESAFSPVGRILTTNGNVNALTAGSLLLCIRFRPLVG